MLTKTHFVRYLVQTEGGELRVIETPPMTRAEAEIEAHWLKGHTAALDVEISRLPDGPITKIGRHKPKEGR